MKDINWFKILIYTGLIFLLAHLHKANYLHIPQIKSLSYLIFSFIALFLGMLFMAINYKYVLKASYALQISSVDSIIANGLSVFLKYIPGKLLIILGRAIYISKRYEISNVEASVASLKSQLINLWIGLLMGSILVFIIPIHRIYVIISVLFIFIFTLTLFSGYFKKYLLFFPNKILKKQLNYPLISIRNIFFYIPSFIFQWTFYGIGFLFLTKAIYIGEISNMVSLAFILAATLGILTIIAPGGLGVREGFLLLLLMSFGIDKQNAIMISTASRLWFLIGEVFIYVLALGLKYLNKELITEADK